MKNDQEAMKQVKLHLDQSLRDVANSKAMVGQTQQNIKFESARYGKAIEQCLNVAKTAQKLSQTHERIQQKMQNESNLLNKCQILLNKCNEFRCNGEKYTKAMELRRKNGFDLFESRYG